MHTPIYGFSTKNAKYKIAVRSDSEEINWVRKNAKYGFVISDSWSWQEKIIYLFNDADYMMYILKWK